MKSFKVFKNLFKDLEERDRSEDKDEINQIQVLLADELLFFLDLSVVQGCRFTVRGTQIS